MRLHLPAPGTYNQDKQPLALTPAKSSGFRSREMDLQLAILETIRPAGMRLTQRVIAEVCGCSNALIYLITKTSLAKMQREAKRRHLLEVAA